MWYAGDVNKLPGPIAVCHYIITKLRRHLAQNGLTVRRRLSMEIFNTIVRGGRGLASGLRMRSHSSILHVHLPFSTAHA
jgi:hypothetical protein